MSVLPTRSAVGFVRSSIVGNRKCAGWDGLAERTIRHASAFALGLAEQVLLSCSAFEGCGLIRQQSRSASAGQVPSPLLGKVPASRAAVYWSWRSSSPQNESEQARFLVGDGGFIPPDSVQGKTIQVLHSRRRIIVSRALLIPNLR